MASGDGGKSEAGGGGKKRPTGHSYAHPHPYSHSHPHSNPHSRGGGGTFTSQGTLVAFRFVLLLALPLCCLVFGTVALDRVHRIFQADTKRLKGPSARQKGAHLSLRLHTGHLGLGLGRGRGAKAQGHGQGRGQGLFWRHRKGSHWAEGEGDEGSSAASAHRPSSDNHESRGQPDREGVSLTPSAPKSAKGGGGREQEEGEKQQKQQLQLQHQKERQTVDEHRQQQGLQKQYLQKQQERQLQQEQQTHSEEAQGAVGAQGQAQRQGRGDSGASTRSPRASQQASKGLLASSEGSGGDRGEAQRRAMGLWHTALAEDEDTWGGRERWEGGGGKGRQEEESAPEGEGEGEGGKGAGGSSEAEPLQEASQETSREESSEEQAEEPGAAGGGGEREGGSDEAQLASGGGVVYLDDAAANAHKRLTLLSNRLGGATPAGHTTGKPGESSAAAVAGRQQGTGAGQGAALWGWLQAGKGRSEGEGEGGDRGASKGGISLVDMGEGAGEAETGEFLGRWLSEAKEEGTHNATQALLSSGGRVNSSSSDSGLDAGADNKGGRDRTGLESSLPPVTPGLGGSTGSAGTASAQTASTSAALPAGSGGQAEAEVRTASSEGARTAEGEQQGPGENDLATRGQEKGAGGARAPESLGQALDVDAALLRAQEVVVGEGGMGQNGVGQLVLGEGDMGQGVVLKDAGAEEGGGEAGSGLENRQEGQGGVQGSAQSDGVAGGDRVAQAGSSAGRKGNLAGAAQLIEQRVAVGAGADSDEESDERLFARALAVDSAAQRSGVQPHKIAFMFLTRGPLPLAPLWSKFLSGHEANASVYIHTAQNFQYREGDLPPVFTGRQIHSKASKWGGISIVDAERRLIAHALLDPHNACFVLLSESCIPVFNFSHVYRHLMGSPLSFVRVKDDRGPLGRGRWRKAFKPLVPWDRWRKGSQWVEMRRDVARIITGDTKYYLLFKRHCTGSCYSDEHYFPTMLSMLAPALVANRTLTWSNWRARAFHPETFGGRRISREVIDLIRKDQSCVDAGGRATHCYLFARKFKADALGPLLNLSPYMGF